jgi:outer membrane cobalamin receptor
MTKYRNRLKSVLYATLLLCLPAKSPGQDTNPDLELDEIVVSASRTDRVSGDLPAQVTIIPSETIRRTAAQTMDDVLRQVPGFSLFRRSSSVVAHPTTQGVSLRGVGASGASRTLVLLDGMPLNDPFGGWVQWAKVPVSGVERVEILQGGSAHLWGNYALSGVINLVSYQPESRQVHFAARAGAQQTIGVDAAYHDASARTRWSVLGSVFSTDGYYIAPTSQRGLIDRRARSRNAAIRAGLHHTFGSKTQISAQAGAFVEDRKNGTVLTGNETKSAYLSVNLDRTTQSSGLFRLSAFGQTQRFSSTFSSQAADRNTENPALDQFRVPGSVIGTSLTYRQPIASHHLFSLGVDLRLLEGSTNESYFYQNGTFLRKRQAGGKQLVSGVFAQNVFFLTEQLELTLGARVDRWENRAGFRRETEIATGQAIRDDHHSDLARTVFSPRGGLRYDVTDAISLRTAAYRTYRTATLNELFRPFRVGNNITAANENLDSERLTGIEAGYDLSTQHITVKTTGYWNEIDGSIANLTIGSGPGSVDPCGFVPAGGICRQRSNLDRVRVRGVETEIVRREKHWTGSLSYLYNDTRIRESTNAVLIGKRLPQIPQHGLVLRLSVTDGKRTSATAQVRVIGDQYEDDGNTLGLGAYHVLDLSMQHQIGKKKETFIQVENLLNTSYSVGLTGTGRETLGAPFRLQLGVRTTFEH